VVNENDKKIWERDLKPFHTSLKLQVDRARFRREKAGTISMRKWNKKIKRRNERTARAQKQLNTT